MTIYLALKRKERRGEEQEAHTDDITAGGTEDGRKEAVGKEMNEKRRGKKKRKKEIKDRKGRMKEMGTEGKEKGIKKTSDGSFVEVEG